MGAVRVIDRVADLSDVSGVTGLLWGTYAALPAAGTAGRVYLAWDTGEILTDDGTDWAYLEGAASTACTVSRGGGGGSSSGANVQSGFDTVPLNTVGLDAGGNYNAATYLYTCPVTGYYEVITKLRLVDAAAAGVSFGHGAGTSNSDGPHFQWYTTGAGGRQGSLNIRKAQFSAGDQLRMYAYCDSTIAIASAEMSITLVSA